MRPLRPGEAAHRLGITVKTLYNMEERGEIRSIKLPSGHRRYMAEDIESILDSYREGKVDEDDSEK